MNSHTALLQRGRSPMLARPRRSRTVKSSSRGHAQIHFHGCRQNLCECLCVCVCLYVYRSRSNMFEISCMYKCNVINRYIASSLYITREIIRVSCCAFCILKYLRVEYCFFFVLLEISWWLILKVIKKVI